MAKEVGFSATNGVATTITRGEGNEARLTLYVDGEAQQRLLDNAAAERSMARDRSRKVKYDKVATVPWSEWVKWSLDAAVPLGRMCAEERDIYIRRKLRSSDYERLRSRDKI